jgi:hypothetical protein
LSVLKRSVLEELVLPRTQLIVFLVAEHHLVKALFQASNVKPSWCLCV